MASDNPTNDNSKPLLVLYNKFKTVSKGTDLFQINCLKSYHPCASLLIRRQQLIYTFIPNMSSERSNDIFSFVG